MNNLVSVIMPIYNCENFIGYAVESVINQTYDSWELILVDDASTDNSFDIIKKYANKDSRIRFIRFNKNSGAAVARNKAIEVAKGRFIAFLDCDDMWKKEKLEKQIKFMVDNDIAFSYSNFEVVSEDGKNLNKLISPKNELDYKKMLKGNSIGCLTVIIDKDKIGEFKMPLIKKGQDYATWLSILKEGYKAHKIDESLAVYRRRKNSLSGNMVSSLKRTWNIYYNIEKLGIIKSTYFFIIYIIRAIKKRII